MLSTILNRKIEFEQSNVVKDAIGSPAKVWTSYLETWAGIFTPTRTVQYDDREQLVYTTEFTIRHNNKSKLINNKFRIKYNDNYYKINQIVDVENKAGIMFITTMYDDE